jgi:hypothetical protein
MLKPGAFAQDANSAPERTKLLNHRLLRSCVRSTTKKPSIHFVNLATKSFRLRQLLLNLSARWCGRVDHVHAWNERRLENDGFIKKHSELFPNSKGFGWYAWKPYIILKTLQHADEGDLVIYQDVGRQKPVLIKGPLIDWDQFLNSRKIDCVPGVLIPEWGANRLWTKPEVFRELKLSESVYFDSPQIQASWSVWRKTSVTVNFVAEWADLCSQLRLVGSRTDDAAQADASEFNEHRWDQSLLTILTLRNRLAPLNSSDLITPGSDKKIISHFMPNGAKSLRTLGIEAVSYIYFHLERIVRPCISRINHEVGE